VPEAIATRLPVRNAVMGVYRPVHGDRVWLSVDAVPQLDGDGAVIQVVCTFIDITERVLAEERVGRLLKEKELILKEAHHRIKNNMNALGSLLSLQSEAQSEPAVSAALGDAINRISSMMVLYDKLYRSGASGYLAIKDYLPDLIERIVGNFPKKIPIQIVTDIADVVIAANRLSAIGIIVNELITNSMKYAFAGRTEGTIRVRVEKAGQRVRLLFEDDGVGLPGAGAADTPKGFGMQLIAMLVEQIGGTLAFEGGSGAAFGIEFDA
jgi:two-component sensor histidine kinase